MQDLSQVIILAIVQGLTEFLPISSSAHLILIPKLLGWSDQGLSFDIAIHLGTLLAIFIYFRREIYQMLTKEYKLAWAIILGTIPVGLAGIMFHDVVSVYMRSAWIIAATTLIFGVLLGVATLMAKQQRNEHQLRWRDVVIIGCAQAVALIPGTSRSGITLTAGLFCGLTRTAAARFSFLLSIPVIILAGLFEAYKVSGGGEIIDYRGLGVGFVVAGLSGYLCIDLFLRLIDKFGVMPFVVYRLLLGCVLVYVLI